MSLERRITTYDAHNYLRTHNHQLACRMGWSMKVSPCGGFLKGLEGTIGSSMDSRRRMETGTRTSSRGCPSNSRRAQSA